MDSNLYQAQKEHLRQQLRNGEEFDLSNFVYPQPKEDKTKDSTKEEDNPKLTVMLSYFGNEKLPLK